MQEINFTTSVLMILCLLVFLDSCWDNYSVSKAILKFLAVLITFFVAIIAITIWVIAEFCIFIIFGSGSCPEISEQDPDEGQDDGK
jgi:hypothetical protein